MYFMLFESAVFLIHQNHKWNDIHLYLISRKSTIAHATALRHAGNESAGSIYINGQKFVLAAVASDCSQYRYYMISPQTKIVKPIVSHGCKGWSLTMSTEQMPVVFRKRALRMAFGPKKNGTKSKRIMY